MTSRRSVFISLSPDLHAVSERLLASGRYGTFSEVIRAALRLLDERELDLQEHRETKRVRNVESLAAGPVDA